MTRWRQLDVTDVPGGEGELRLMKRGADFTIMAGPRELMNSLLSGSEEALATLAVQRLGGRPAPHLLIGGLGMGFTLRAALKVAPADAAITVVELVPAVTAWARGPMAALFDGSLDDPRVRLAEDDVGAVIGRAQGTYDAVLLDVDNGPEGLTRRANDRLYEAEGLGLARRALTRGGVLAVWSSEADPAFTERLREVGFAAVHALPIRARAGRHEALHMIWLATAG